MPYNRFMTKARQTQVSTFRDAWVEVNLDYLTQNIKKFTEYLPKDKKLLAVVKADAYGHGVSMMLPTILSCNIDMLGVASIDEALDNHMNHERQKEIEKFASENNINLETLETIINNAQHE